jgi:hypothetical protein
MTLACAAIFVSFFVLVKKGQMRHKKMIVLHKKIKYYNSLLEGIDALDEAERSGVTKRWENREQVMEALTIMRADLVCALRIEKTFRENMNLRSTDFHMNLEPLKNLQMTEQASEYARWFSQALEIGTSVQEEMQSLQRKS